MIFLLTACVVLSEVYPNPVGSESGSGSAGDCREFVEVYNTCPDPVDLRGYRLADNVEQDSIVPFTDSTILRWHRVVLGTTILPGRSFGLILDPEYATSTCAAHPPLPIEDGIVVLGVKDTDLGNGLSSTDTLHWIAPNGGEVERVTGLGVPEGHSLERWSFQDDRWMVSDSLSPGRWNTVSREIDPTVANYQVLPGSLRVWVVERGYQSGTLRVRLLDAGGVVDEVERTVVPLDTVEVVLSTEGIQPWVVGSLQVQMGDILRTYPVYFPSPSEGVRITEIVADGTVEWVELTNLTPDTVHVGGAILVDKAGVKSGVFPDKDLLPGGAVVVVGDSERFWARWGDTVRVIVPTGSTMPALNNQSEQLVLLFPGGVVMDSVAYERAAPFDQSLERRTPSMPAGPSSWQVVTSPSPGVYEPPSLPPVGSMRLSARVFRPPQEVLEIQFALPEGDQVRRIRVFNDRGRLVRVFSGVGGLSRGVVVWDGRDDGGEMLPAGLYLVVVDGERTSLRKVVGLWIR